MYMHIQISNPQGIVNNCRSFNLNRSQITILFRQMCLFNKIQRITHLEIFKMRQKTK